MATDKKKTAEYDAMLDKNAQRLADNAAALKSNPELQSEANAMNSNIQDENNAIRAFRQSSVGAGRGEVNPPNAYKKGGKVRSPASKRADGIITKGHTKGRYM